MADLITDAKPSKIWTQKEVATYLGVGVKTVRRIESSKPDFPRGMRLTERTVRYDAEAVQRWATGGAG